MKAGIVVGLVVSLVLSKSIQATTPYPTNCRAILGKLLDDAFDGAHFFEAYSFARLRELPAIQDFFQKKEQLGRDRYANEYMYYENEGRDRIALEFDARLGDGRDASGKQIVQHFLKSASVERHIHEMDAIYGLIDITLVHETRERYHSTDVKNDNAEADFLTAEKELRLLVEASIYPRNLWNFAFASENAYFYRTPFFEELSGILSSQTLAYRNGGQWYIYEPRHDTHLELGFAKEDPERIVRLHAKQQIRHSAVEIDIVFYDGRLSAISERRKRHNSRITQIERELTSARKQRLEHETEMSTGSYISKYNDRTAFVVDMKQARFQQGNIIQFIMSASRPVPDFIVLEDREYHVQISKNGIIIGERMNEDGKREGFQGTYKIQEIPTRAGDLLGLFEVEIVVNDHHHWFLN